MLAQVDYIPDSLSPWFDDPRWWLRNSAYRDPRVLVRGIPLPEIVEQLRLVFDEQACRQLLVDGYWAPLLGLFSGQPCIRWFGLMVALGIDLRTLGSESARRYFAALRSGAQWLGARIEVGIEAGLRRAGYGPTRPELPLDAKQWDFTLPTETLPTLIECKSMSTGNLEGNFDHVEQRFQNVGFEYQRERCIAGHLCLSRWMVEAMREHDVQVFYESVLPEFTEELTRALRRVQIGGAPCRVGRFGNVAMAATDRSDGFLEAWDVCGYERVAIHRLRRLMNTCHEATRNFMHAPASSERIAVVWLGEDYLSPVAVSRFIEQHMGATFRAHKTRLELARHLLGFDHAVLLSARRSDDSTAYVVDKATFRIDTERTRLSASLFEALSAWHFHVTLDGS